MTALPTSRARTLWLPGIAVAALGLSLTFWLARLQQQTTDTLSHTRFTEEVRSSSNAITQRLKAGTEVVEGLRDLFLLKPDLSRSEFDRIVAERNLRQRYPEIRGLSFARWVPRAKLEAFEERRRAQTPPGEVFTPIHPVVERDDYYINEYVWPPGGNNGVLGLDIASQPGNLEAMLTARGTGRTALSAPFSLVQETDLPTGVVIRAPVFDSRYGANLSDEFVGTATASIRIVDVIRAARANGFLRGIMVRMDDMGPVGEPLSTPLMLAAPPHWPSDAHLQETQELQLHGRRWRLTFASLGSTLSATEQLAPRWVMGLGMAISLLLAALMSLLVRMRALALHEVALSHKALQHSEESLRIIFNQAAVGVAQIHTATGRPVRLNERYCAIFGYTQDELRSMSIRDLVNIQGQDEDLANQQKLQSGEIQEYQLEKCMQRKDGRQIWIDLTVSSMRNQGEAHVYHIAVVQDITERRQLQDSLRDNERYLRNILQHLPVGLSIVRHDGRFLYCNESNIQICGYQSEDIPDAESWWRKAHPDPQVRERTRAQWLAACEQARQGNGRIPAREYEIRCKNGQMRLVEIAGMVLGKDYLVTMIDLSQRKAAEDKIRHLAYYDALTQLPNRRLLRDHLQQVLGHAKGHRFGALLLLDIDNFKTLNDTRGHDQGDALLCEVARRLRDSACGSQMVARLGGDEFVVVLENLASNLESGMVLARERGLRILSALRQPYALEGGPFHASASIGVTVFQCGKEESISDLLKRADMAMYQAKATGRNALEFYDPQIQAIVRARAELGADIRTGLAAAQFELFYQPQVEGHTVIGSEALLRWRHPLNGHISPAVFIPLAEETGLILPLGEWVLNTACRQLAAWAQDPGRAHLTLAVNVSPRQFRQPGFVAQVLTALEGSGAPPHKLKLELTEGLLLDNIEDTIQKMSQLKAHGVGFALDDFGTGYSSLSYLKQLPLDQLKIDQGFVRDVLTDPNDASIVCTIIALGTSLGLHVIAEGVETEAQRDFLRLHGCQAWQGYLFSRPICAEQFTNLPLTYEPS